MSDTRIGYLSAATDPAANPNTVPGFDAMHAAALYRPGRHTFDAHGTHVADVVLGFAPPTGQACWLVAYEVTLTATGEVFRGLDFEVPDVYPPRDRNAALALLDAIGRSSGNAYLCEYVATQSPAWLTA